MRVTRNYIASGTAPHVIPKNKNLSENSLRGFCFI